MLFARFRSSSTRKKWPLPRPRPILHPHVVAEQAMFQHLLNPGVVSYTRHPPTLQFLKKSRLLATLIASANSLPDFTSGADSTTRKLSHSRTQGRVRDGPS